MLTPVRILIIEDNLDDLELIIRELSQGGFDVTSHRIETEEEMQRALEQGTWDVILSDYYLPRFDALRALTVLKMTGLDTPFILVSGTASVQTAVDAMRAGAHDYISKDDLSRLSVAVQHELNEARVRAERRQAREALTRIYAELERRIEERTEDLRMANERLSLEIEERRRAEVELATSREQLQLAIDSLGGGYWDNRIESFDPETLERIDSSYYADPGLQRLLGITSSQLSQRIWIEHIHPDDVERVLREVNSCFLSECQFFESDFRIVHSDGRIIWVASRALVVKNERGMPVRWTGVAWDITERKSAEAVQRNAYDDLEQRVMERTAELIEANALLVEEVETRTLAEQKLQETTDELSQERLALEHKNIALKEILQQVRSDREALKQRLVTNIEETLVPSVQKLKLVQHADVRRLAGTMEQDLANITSTFVSDLKRQFETLSPREIEICRLIKNGLPTKEIAEMLNLSPMTIQKHRETIRKKLGLTNEEVNLQAYLQSAPETL